MKNLLKNEKFKKLLNVKVISSIIITFVLLLLLILPAPAENIDNSDKTIVTKNTTIIEDVLDEPQDKIDNSYYCNIPISDIFNKHNAISLKKDKYEKITDSSKLKEIAINLVTQLNNANEEYMDEKYKENTKQKMEEDYEKLYKEYKIYAPDLKAILNIAKLRHEKARIEFFEKRNMNFENDYDNYAMIVIKIESIFARVECNQ